MGWVVSVADPGCMMIGVSMASCVYISTPTVLAATTNTVSAPSPLILLQSAWTMSRFQWNGHESLSHRQGPK